MKKLRIIVIAIFLLLLLITPYIRVEILTYRHGSDFETLYKLTNMIDEIEYLKVMEYSEASASVFYVSKNSTSGNLLQFERQDEQWLLDSWETVWSKTGSADSFIWPYYR